MTEVIDFQAKKREMKRKNKKAEEVKVEVVEHKKSELEKELYALILKYLYRSSGADSACEAIQDLLKVLLDLNKFTFSQYEVVFSPITQASVIYSELYEYFQSHEIDLESVFDETGELIGQGLTDEELDRKE